MKTKEKRLLAGAGGKKGGGSARTPVEAPDNVQSRSLASILDLLGEGKIGGLVDGGKSIFLDNVPLLNPDGTSNFNGITWWFRDGSQNQSVIEGFDAIETPKDVGVRIKTTSPRTIQIDNDDADQVRIIMMFPKLANTDRKTGDTYGATVEFQFSLAVGDKGFEPITPVGYKSPVINVSKKSSGKHYREYLFDLPKPGTNYRIRVDRLTPDSKTDYVNDQTWMSSYGEIVNSKLAYPNSALVGIRIDSQQFGSSMPSRSYLVKGLEIRVPSNYRPDTNTYHGDWDGTFSPQVSDNPAWILYDILTSKRYGLGQYIQESMINIAQLYQIGRYCDQEVSDGFGGLEKRFSINTVINSRGEAYRVLQDITSVFRGMIFWAGGMVNIMQDSPSTPIMQFTSANIIGKVSYKGTSRKDRSTVAMITYNDKDDLYKQNIEYVEDREGIKRFGIRKTESVAFGCTSRGQAHRVGLWTLYSNRMETDLITFKTGLDASLLMPGELVKLQDKFRSGKRNSGRVKSFTANSITLDAPVKLEQAGNSISFLNAKGKMIDRNLIEGTGEHTTVTFKQPISEEETPVPLGIWTITEPNLEPMIVRILSVNQGEEKGSFDIVGVQHNPTKFTAIDQGAKLTPSKITALDPTFSKPENLMITEGTYLSSPGNLSVKLTVSWEGKSPSYILRWRRSDVVEGWKTIEVTEEQYDILSVAENGEYDIEVYAISMTGRRTATITTTYKTLGTMTPPNSPSALTAIGDYRQIILNWLNPDSIDLDKVNVYASKINDLSSSALIAEVASSTFTHSGINDDETWYYWVRAVNKRGMLSNPNSNLGTEATTKNVLSFLKNQITKSELGQELLSDIDGKATNEAVDSIKESIDESVKKLDESVTGISDSFADMEEAQKKLKETVDGTQSKIDKALGDVNDSVAKVTTLRETVEKQSESIAGTLSAVNAAVSSNKAQIAAEQEARVMADEALSKRVDSMKSIVDEGQSSIQKMQQTVSDVEKSTAGVTSNIEAIAKANIDLALRQHEDVKKQSVTNAKIQSEQQTIADSVSAVSKKVDLIKAEIGDNIVAQLAEEKEARASADETLSKRVSKLSAEMDDNIKASIIEESKARATADEALSKQITALKSEVDTNIKSAIKTESETRTTQDVALASQISSLNAEMTNNKAAINTETQARANEDQALSKRIDSLTAEMNNNVKAAINSEAKTRADADTAVSNTVKALEAKVNDVAASVTTESQARASADNALGKRIDSVNAKTDQMSATVQQTSKAVADVNGKLSASWTLKMETSGKNNVKYAAGMSLGIDGGTSQFLVRADRFGLVNSVDGKITTPFVVNNGVTYMNGAYIQDGTITNAKVGDLQSNNYAAGKTGWRISKGGGFEINGNTSGAGRMVISNNRIDVYDERGVLRVRLGLL
ncbi:MULTISPECIES: phage tail tip fiber protein [Photorhabdus]|uniref:Phage tail protein n=1 Tax=Photorhabdus asymbiotica TaxID=291112 RepID=A0ABX9SFR6_9GAMM|nr:phage tail protein [Photorhabdus asymbiotica]RKS53966.1 putative phage tail protein [Photorhabdus asymbiotica]